MKFLSRFIVTTYTCLTPWKPCVVLSKQCTVCSRTRKRLLDYHLNGDWPRWTVFSCIQSWYVHTQRWNVAVRLKIFPSISYFLYNLMLFLVILTFVTFVFVNVFDMLGLWFQENWSKAMKSLNRIRWHVTRKHKVVKLYRDAWMWCMEEWPKLTRGK